MQLIMVLGYLGSGKTTFVKNALNAIEGKKAVIVNDFGSLDIDGLILEKETNVLKKIYDGSIFCSCKSDMFVASMLEVINENPDVIIVEASGLANPYTMLREINLIETKGNVKFEINVFCLVDALNFEKILPICHAIKIQLAQSDVVVLNKIDLANKVTINRVESLIKESTDAQVIKTIGSKIDQYFGYKTIEKKLPRLIEDITLQKMTLNVGNCKKEDLDAACLKLSEKCSRIKGVVKIDNVNYIYEFIDGESKITGTNSTDSFLIILSCFRNSLYNSVKDIIKEYDFLEIK